MTSALHRLLLLLPLICRPGLGQSPLEQALTLTRAKHYAEAEKAIEGVSEPVQSNARIAFHRLKAAIASGLGEHSQAADQMQMALALSPDDHSLAAATALAEFEAGRLDDALKNARASGDTPNSQVLIGDIEERRGEFLKAADAYRSAVALAPDREQYRITLGFELIRHQAFEPAIQMLQQSASMFPQSARIRALLGIAQYSEGYTKEAIEILNEAISIDPKLDSAYRCLAQIVLQSSAAPSQSVVHSLCSWNQVVCSAVKLRVARENHDAALQHQALLGLKAAPAQDAVGQCELARAYEWSGEEKEARTHMEACVRLDPSPQNHYRLGLLYGKLGLTDIAHREMAIRNEKLQRMSEQTAEGLSALEQFQYGLKQ